MNPCCPCGLVGQELDIHDDVAFPHVVDAQGTHTAQLKPPFFPGPRGQGQNGGVLRLNVNSNQRPIMKDGGVDTLLGAQLDISPGSGGRPGPRSAAVGAPPPSGRPQSWT